MFGESRPWQIRGESVEIATPTLADDTAYREAVTRSSSRLSTFAMPDPNNLAQVVAAQSPTYRSFFVRANEPVAGHDLVGRVNIANIVFGAFRSATLGYDAYDPYAGQGLFVEGLRMVIDLAFDDEPDGLGLHRLEANIQPENVRSAGLVRSLGFWREGFSRDYLHMSGTDGQRAWRDHDRYTVLADDWPAVPYRHAGPGLRVAAVVAGVPAGDPGSLAPLIAAELGVPLYSARVVEETATLFELLRVSPPGGVVETRVTGPELRMGLARARFDPAVVPILEPLATPSKRDVVERALAVRAAFAAAAD